MNKSTEVMRSLIFRLFILLGGPIFIVAKPASAQTSQPLPEFSKIRIVDNIQVELVIADRYSIYIEDKAPNQENINVTNGFLSLNAGNARGKKIKIFTKNVEQIILDGVARIESLDTLRGDKLHIQLDGASKAKLIIAYTAFKANLDGGSEAIVSGSANQVSANIDGAAQLKAIDLICSEATLNADGAAQVKLTVNQSLTAKADGTSKITVKGNPTNRQFSVDGIAKIEVEEQHAVADTLIIEEEKEVVTNGDTTRVKLGKRRLMIIEDNNDEQVYGPDHEEKPKKQDMKSVWGGFELGVNGFTTPSLDFSLPTPYDFLNTNMGSSWFFSLNLPEIDGQIIKNKLAVTTGIGMTWSNIRFDGNSYITPNLDSLAPTTTAAGVNLSKNKLYTYDITAPLLIKWAPGTAKKSNGGFHVATGAIFHYVATKKIVTETSSLGYDQRMEQKDDLNINTFRVDATLRVGFDWVRLFVNYSLTPYFKSDAAPDIRLFSGGITLIGF